jgi:hypothetical protein
MINRSSVLAGSLLLSVASGLLFAAGLPTPLIQSGLEAGSVILRGSISLPPAGSVNSIKIFVNNQEASAAKLLLELSAGEFEIHLNQALKGGDRVQLQHFATPNLSSEKSPVRRIPGTPEILGKLEEGATKVQVLAVAGASAVFAVVNDSGDTVRVQAAQAAVPAECAKDAEKCKVEIKVAALGEGERVRVQEERGPLSDPMKVSAKAIVADKASINSVEAYYGASSVKVFFSKLDKKVEKAKVKIRTCLETKERAFTEDELSASSITVSLDRGFYCADEGHTATVTLSTQAKGEKTFIDVSQGDIEALIPRIALSAPLREGDTSVAGAANGGVSKVRIQVYSGWQLEALSPKVTARKIADKEKELKEVEVKRGQPPATVVEAALQRAQLEAKERKLLREISELKEPAATATALVASSPAEQAAVEKCRAGELVQEIDEQAVTDGRFSVPLDGRLSAGECVIALAVFPNAAPVTATKPLERVVSSRSEIVGSVALDWGRLRGYFSLGGAVSHYREQFSQVDTFVGFTSDARILGQILDKDKSANGPLELGRFRWQVNFFTDARLSVRLANASGAANTPSGAAPATQTPTPVITDPRLSFDADQPGYLLGAIHVPMSFKGMDWRYQGEQYSFFASPIFRFGGQTQNQPTVASRHLQVKPNSSPRSFDVLREDTRNGVLPMWGYGARFGLYKYDLLATSKRLKQPAQERQVANDPIGYADIIWGKSYAQRSYTYAYTIDGNRSVAGNYLAISDPKLTDVEISSRVRNRLYIETRLKIPKLPALIGADLSIRNNAADYEPNQLRFVVAFRIDAQKALGKVFGDDLVRRR